MHLLSDLLEREVNRAEERKLKVGKIFPKEAQRCSLQVEKKIDKNFVMNSHLGFFQSGLIDCLIQTELKFREDLQSSGFQDK